ncbi:hypothetical protein RHMOL_Rhmol08G0163600 [Rhododendron molle]|uniref:Uncharacterized protein n=1 Tax=Rhododendron molle TaxID=49168 RepID=A0ACC0MNX5_RHOML|nr:hypothetical protein RHMOL_Rhmol08G0163600 [Rhododendron molle]
MTSTTLSIHRSASLMTLRKILRGIRMVLTIVRMEQTTLPVRGVTKNEDGEEEKEGGSRTLLFFFLVLFFFLNIMKIPGDTPV